MKFHKTLSELMIAVGDCALEGTWSEYSQNGMNTFRAKTGEVLNWWPSKGTLQFQGKNLESFKEALAVALGNPTKLAVAKPSVLEKKIFVVHGHDREARDQLELILMRLGLQ